MAYKVVETDAVHDELVRTLDYLEFVLFEPCLLYTSTAIIASGSNFPDALAAATLAGDQSAPILLTAPDSLSPEVASRLSSLCLLYTSVPFLSSGSCSA